MTRKLSIGPATHPSPPSIDLRSLDDATLRSLAAGVAAEGARRKEEAASKALERCRAWATKLTFDAVDLMAPAHGRTSCSDIERINGLSTMTDERRSPRCARCALLDIVEGGYHGDFALSLHLEIDFSRDPAS